MALKSFIYNLLIIIIVAYVFNAIYTFWQLYHPPACDTSLPSAANTCVWPMCDCSRDEIELFVYYGDSTPLSSEDFATSKTLHHTLLLKRRFKCNAEFSEAVKLPETRAVSRSYAHVYAACTSLLENQTKIPVSAYHYYRSSLTTRLGEILEPKMEKNLLSSAAEAVDAAANQEMPKARKSSIPALHVHKNLNVHVMQDDFVLNRSAVVHELLPYIKIVPSPSSKADSNTMVYLPVLVVDEMSRKRDDYVVVVAGSQQQPLNLTISYAPIKLGKIRLFALLSQSFKQLKQLGFRQQDIEDVSGIFTDTNLYLLLVTMIISVLHIWLDFMAFKNEISFWRTKGTRDQNRGLSARTVLWRLGSSIVIFFYLLDEKSSALVLVPCAVAIGVEAWKISKVWNIEIVRRSSNRTPGSAAAAKSRQRREQKRETTKTALLEQSTDDDFPLHTTMMSLGKQNKKTDGHASEKPSKIPVEASSTYYFTFLPWHLKISSISDARTEKFDAEAMKYLTWVLYPLCLAGAVYSLFYVKHRSWYSWAINSLVNGIYAFGFLFMVPQLFLNYRLKSVAHLPWRAFAYKAVNTFIDDLFAFIIRMPTAHRLACFRDDIVFVVYLVQRWIYPVDKSRSETTTADDEVEEVDVTTLDVKGGAPTESASANVSKETKKRQ